MVLTIVVFLCALGSVFLQSDRDQARLDLMQSIKSEIPTLDQSSIWTVLSEADAEQVGNMASLLNKGLHKYQTENRDATYVLSKGERIIIDHVSPGVQLDTLYKLPYGNSLSLLSFSLAILLEGHQPSTIHGSMGEALSDKDRSKPMFSAYKENSLFSLLNTLPKISDSESVMNSDMLNSKLDTNGKVAMSYVNSVLGKTKSEAWLDAFFALAIEEAPMTQSGQLKMTLYHILYYALSVIHEISIIDSSLSANDLTIVDRHFMFGWWINCPQSLDVCLFPGLPEDLILSASPSLRIYISPSLELSLITFNTKTTGIKSLSDIVRTDKAIWTEIRSSLEAVGSSSDRFSKSGDAEPNADPLKEPVKESADNPNAESDAAESDAADSEDRLVRLIHQVWPVLVFVFWVVSSHVWVYWMLHCFWFVGTYASKRTHIPRLKTAAK